MSTVRPGHAAAGAYAIRVQGLLDARWAARFDGCTLRHDADGTTVIAGTVVDQAALHGLLQVLRDLGVPLLSVTPVEPDPPPVPSPAAAAPAAHATPRSTP